MQKVSKTRCWLICVQCCCQAGLSRTFLIPEDLLSAEHQRILLKATTTRKIKKSGLFYTDDFHLANYEVFNSLSSKEDTSYSIYGDEKIDAILKKNIIVNFVTMIHALY